MICKVCHQEWTAGEINSDGVCDYCWNTHGEDWVGE